MTDRVLHKVLVSDVKVKKGRQRSEMGDMEGLAESLLKHGQMFPILLNRENQLIAGERRLEAHKMNGMLYIDAVYREEMDELDLEELELEENIQRKQLTWQEQNAAIARLHQLRMKRDPNWTQAQTAALIKDPDAVAPQQRDVSEALTLEKMMAMFPEIKQAKSKSKALNLARNLASQVNKIVDVRERPKLYQEIGEKLYHGDSVEVIKQFENESIDCIITDPPFGVDYDKQMAGSVRSADAYKDDAELYEHILTMVPDLYRVLRPDSFCIWFFGISWYERVKHVFRQAGFTVDEIPLMWNRSRGRTFTTSPKHLFAKGYDVALHAFKGDPTIVRKRHNVFDFEPVSTAERELTVERPIELYEELIKSLTIPGQVVADFFVGSGSCPAAAVKNGRDWVGVEKDEARRASAIQKIRSYIPS